MSATFIPSRRQQVWGWPALINFSVASAGAALFLFEAASNVVKTGATYHLGASLTGWLAPLLLAGGMAPLALEAGRPARVRYVLSNLRTSWMSRESLAALVFLPASILHLVWPGWLWTMIGAVAAASFLLSQGMIVQRCRAVPAWSSRAVVPLLVSSSLLTGAALFLGIRLWEAPQSPQTRFAVILSLAVTLLDVMAWTCYLKLSKESGFGESTGWLRRRSFYLIMLGRVLPALVLTIALWRSLAPSSIWTWAGLLAVSATIAAAVVQKVGLLRYCGYLREIGLPRGIAPSSARPLAGALQGR